MHFPFPHDLSLAFLLVSSLLKQSNAPAQVRLLPILKGEEGLSYLCELNLESSSQPIPEVGLLGGSKSCKVDNRTDPQGFHLTLIRMAVAKETNCSNCRWGCADRVTLEGSYQRRLPRPQGKSVWRCLRKLTPEQTDETVILPQTDPKWMYQSPTQPYLFTTPKEI